MDVNESYDDAEVYSMVKLSLQLPDLEDGLSRFGFKSATSSTVKSSPAVVKVERAEVLL